MSMALAAILRVFLGSVAFVGIVIFLVWFFLRRHKNVSRTSEPVHSNPSIQVETSGRAESSLRGVDISFRETEIFDVEDLYMATRNFSCENFIREGKFGRVYRGIFPNGTVIVVKMRPGEKTEDFADKALTLSSVQHRNLVTLLGYCQENNLQFLVYEYIPAGNVCGHLFRELDNDSHPMLEFKYRLGIATGAAKGLGHLHYHRPRVLHKDFKTANVLIDEYFIAKVSGAGNHYFLARVDPSDAGPSSEVSSDEIFLAPEVIESSNFSSRSDVYSFGVFLLELVSGRQAKEPPFSDSSSNLVEWVRNNEESDEIMNIVDEKLGRSGYTEEGMRGCIELSIRCIHPSRGMRPGMKYVVNELQRILRHEIGMTEESTI